MNGSPPITLRRLRVYAALGLCAVIAGGWGTEYSSCTRSQFWGSYFNGVAHFQEQQAARSLQFAKVSLKAGDLGRYHLDLREAAAQRAEAQALTTRRLVCLHFPLPETPRHGL